MATQPPTKRRKKLLLKAKQYDLIAEAWMHYKSYVGATEDDDGDDEEIEEEMEKEDEAGDIDEIFEAISLLSQLDVPKKTKSDASVVLNADSFASIMLSMSYLHIANHSMSEELDQSTEHYFEQSLIYWPENPASNSLLADYHKQMKVGSDNLTIICDLYVKAATYAGIVRGAAMKFVDTTLAKEEDRLNLKEMVEILVMGGALDMSEEEEEEVEEEEDEKDDDDEQVIDSYSNVEVSSSFMSAMLLSCLGKHDDALAHLRKFRFSHRIHPNVWNVALGQDSDDKKKSPIDTKAMFEPRMYHSKEGVLPQEHYHRLCKLFAPNARYWDESDYNNRGYYSYYFDIKTKTRNVVEDAIINHLLPVAERTLQQEHESPSPKIVGAEWWVHTRPHSANLGHPLHFDTDEWLLNSKHEVSHPIVSSVLYLTGGGTGAGSTIVFDQAPDAKENATQVWLSEPKNNHFMNFPGNLLHGVLPCVGGSSSDSESDKNRLTLMVGFWTRDVRKGMKNRKLYSPCGPLPPATEEHSWVLEALQKKVKQAPGNEVESTTLKGAFPAWERIDYSDCIQDSAPFDVPTNLDHQYFVSNAPHCFATRLFSKDNCD